ncbi:hypothetical protein TWF506_002105 [Arthrobotrys conoides]|uniref:Uncharacterized protein n=1 Tax=Arthrobotrys conoides TaxID=74498 RepID=A0AAN8NHM7_9PEZI
MRVYVRTFQPLALISIGWGSIILFTCFITQGQSYIISMPTWNQYVQSQWINFEAIAHQIDVLKYTINEDCPVGNGIVFLPALVPEYRRSLAKLVDILGEARLAFRMSFTKMNQLSMMVNREGSFTHYRQRGTIPPAESLQKMLDEGWGELWPSDHIKEILDEMHLVGGKSASFASRIADYFNDIPGWEHDDSITQQTNIDNLARIIDSDGNFEVGDVAEGVIIIPGPQQARAVLKNTLRTLLEFLTFSRNQFKDFASKASIEMANPLLIDLIRDHDPNHGEGETPFTFVELLGSFVKWYECWIPEFQDLLYLIDHRLGPLPEPE